MSESAIVDALDREIARLNAARSHADRLDDLERRVQGLERANPSIHYEGANTMETNEPNETNIERVEGDVNVEQQDDSGQQDEGQENQPSGDEGGNE